MSKRQRFTISEMYCTECGKQNFSIPRKVGQQREPGHLKKLYCVWCGKETNCAEVRPYGSYRKEDFEEEFKLGRFVNGQKIPISELMGCSKITCNYNRDGRCWNSDHSFLCSHRIIKENPNDETRHLLQRGW